MTKCVIILLAGAGALLYSNRVSLKVFIVVTVLALQFFCLAWPEVLDHRQAEDSYRISQRMEARRAWFEHPSPDAEAANEEEQRLLSNHLANREMLAMALVLALDAVGVYYCWPNETKETKAQPGAAPKGGPATRLGNSGVTEGPPSVS